jgi:hypothetical protein
MFDIYAKGSGLARGVTPEQCWAVVSDHNGWQNWAPAIKRSVLTAEGEGEPNGLGARRRFEDTNGGSFGEVINIYSKPNLFGYHINEDAPLKDHQGVISFNAVDGGTEIIWFMSANNNGYIGGAEARAGMLAAMQQVMDLCVEGLIKACEARRGQ